MGINLDIVMLLENYQRPENRHADNGGLHEPKGASHVRGCRAARDEKLPATCFLLF